MRDMMQRMSRQVLTAGKADEVVSDSGGPLPNHSVFTGHLINGLKGAATDSQGILTASGLTAYVYQSVRSDDHSNQTPHFGHLQGDGDMIFLPPQTQPSDAESAEGTDTLYAVPAISNHGENRPMTEIEKTKHLLSESRHRISLFDQVAQQTRETLSLTLDNYFVPQGPVTNEIFNERIRKYEESVNALIKSEMLIGFWGANENLDSLTLPIKRLAERVTIASGNTFLLNLRWYPIALLIYAGGLGSVAASRYDTLSTLLSVPVPDQHTQQTNSLAKAMTRSIAQTYEMFKTIEGHERHYVPFSEYLYKFFQPLCDDILFTGTDYELLFDRFEVFLALQYAQEDLPDAIPVGRRVWGPVGRFGWRGRHSESGPLQQLIGEAQREGHRWPPLLAGLFGGTLSRFMDLANGLQDYVNQLQWF